VAVRQGPLVCVPPFSPWLSLPPMASLGDLLKEELSEGTLAALQEFLRDTKLGEGEGREAGEEGEPGEAASKGYRAQGHGDQGTNTDATLDPLSSSLSSNSEEHCTSGEGRQGPSASPAQEGSSRSGLPQDDKPADVTAGLAREEARFRENWGLSQFWYEDATAEAVAQEVIRIAGAQGTPG